MLNGLAISNINNNGVNVTIQEVVNGITVTPPAANEITVSSTSFPVTVSYNATVIEGGGMADNGLPAGGTTGQFLRKLSGDDYDAQWQTVNDINTTYAISAETATGGVNLRLSGSDTTTDDVKFAAGANVTVTRTDANTITIAATDAVGITAVSQDTNPSLGGNLNVNGNKIVSSGNANIEIEPNGTGDVYLNADTVRIGDANTTAILTSNGQGNLRVGAGANINFTRASNRTSISGSNVDTGDLAEFTVNGVDYGFEFQSTRGFSVSTQTQNFYVDGTTNGAVNLQSNGSGAINLTAGSGAGIGSQLTLSSGTGDAVLRGGSAGAQITVGGATNSNIVIEPSGTGDVQLNADTVRVGDQNAAKTITTWGTGNLTINTNSGSSSGSIVIASGANGNISITPNGTGSIVLDGLNWPQADGSNNWVLKTNGTGQLAWASVNSLGLNTGINAVQDDVAPTLGGNLDVNNFPITNTRTNGDIKLNPNGTGKVKISNIAYPNSDGSAGQVLKTDGSGTTSWVSKQDPTVINDNVPTTGTEGQHWYRPVTGSFYTRRSGDWEPVNDDGYF